MKFAARYQFSLDPETIASGDNLLRKQLAESFAVDASDIELDQTAWLTYRVQAPTKAIAQAWLDKNPPVSRQQPNLVSLTEIDFEYEHVHVTLDELGEQSPRPKCAICPGNGHDHDAEFLAPQGVADVEWVPICACHADGWWGDNRDGKFDVERSRQVMCALRPVRGPDCTYDATWKTELGEHAFRVCVVEAPSESLAADYIRRRYAKAPVTLGLHVALFAKGREPEAREDSEATLELNFVGYGPSRGAMRHYLDLAYEDPK